MSTLPFNVISVLFAVEVLVMVQLVSMMETQTVEERSTRKWMWVVMVTSKKVVADASQGAERALIV